MPRTRDPLNEHKIKEIQKFMAKLKKEGFWSTRRVRKSLLAILQYQMPKEEDDFYKPEHEIKLKDHILSHMIVLEEFRKWLSL